MGCAAVSDEGGGAQQAQAGRTTAETRAADTVAAARVSAVVRAWRLATRRARRADRAAQPTFAFSRAGAPLYEIRGADAAGLREAVQRLKSDDV